MQPAKKIDWGKRLAALRQRRGESKAVTVVTTLLEDCGECSDDDAKRLKVGIGVEAEHTRDPKQKKKIALTHMGENPDYYPPKAKPKGAKEALRWVKSNKAIAKPKAAFYPTM